MENITKMYAKFLNDASEDKDKEVVTKRFNKIFVNVRFDHEEKRFNKEFLERFFKRKKII